MDPKSSNHSSLTHCLTFRGNSNYVAYSCHGQQALTKLSFISMKTQKMTFHFQTNPAQPFQQERRWDSGKARRQQITFCDIQIEVVILLLVNISIPCKFHSTQNPSDLDFDLPGSLKVKSDDIIRLTIYGFLLMINSNIGPNSAPLRDINL